MKASEQPQISKKWWASGRPTEIKGTDLEKALQNAEKAVADEQRKKDPRSINNCISAIQAVGAAATKTISKECDKKKHKDVIAVLKRFDGMVKNEVRRLQEALQAAESGENGDDEEPDDNGLFDTKYLTKCIKQVRRRELSFACGVHSKGEQSSIIFSKKKPGKYLFRVMKGNRELGLPVNRLTFGVAYPDKEDSTMMVLKLDEEAKQPLGIIKKMRKLFKKQKDKYRPFREVKIIFRGQVVEDIPDPEDTETDELEEGDEATPEVAEAERATAGASETSSAETAGGSAATGEAGAAGPAEGDLTDELGRAERLGEVWDRARQAVLEQIAKLRRELDRFDNPGIAPVSAGLDSLSDRIPVLNLDFSQLENAARSNDRAQFDQAREAMRSRFAEGQDLLARDEILRTIDENPFVDTDVFNSVNDALASIASELAG